jgi:hypothetical protein
VLRDDAAFGRVTEGGFPSKAASLGITMPSAMKPDRLPYPKRPVKAALMHFMVLSVFIGAFIPFDAQIRRVWPLALGYCALLSTPGMQQWASS